jgi:hypothetical protein
VQEVVIGVSASIVVAGQIDSNQLFPPHPFFTNSDFRVKAAKLSGAL